eukprot:TRINITY_DN359_c0_g1_i8.p1 TRINITY_DN359_c0_g1~~TRINITY_DN359_c0_g1_i8.p1  ORF type:complete len:250 (-),score=64.29 TRINITY_DN359_c0_g1_i8:147-803(-)
MAIRFLAIVALAAVAVAEDVSLDTALAADDLCQANGENCGVELLQVKGEMKAAAIEESQADAEADTEAEAEAYADADADADAEAEADTEMSQEEQDAFEESLKLDAADMEDESYRGYCRNRHDMKIWKNGGHRLFDKALAKFGRQCVAGVPCTKSLLHKKAGYSWKCASCMAGLVACSASPKCIGVCIAGQTPACNHCVKHKCRPRFKRCSGLNAGGH